MSRSSVQTLGTAIDAFIDSYKLRTKIDAVRVVEAWAVLAGPQINGVTDRATMRGRTLHVTIRSAAWRHALHLQRGEWRERLNDQLGQALVDDIVFR